MNPLTYMIDHLALVRAIDDEAITAFVAKKQH
jgi:hypothetical protein